MNAKFYYKNSNAPRPNRPNHIGIAAIIKYKNQILFEKRADCGRWALIGGGLKTDESLEECLKREIFEETGLEIHNYKFVDILDDPSRITQYPDGNILRTVTVLYSCELGNVNNLVISDESTELKFFAIEELRDLDIVETHRHIVDSYILNLSCKKGQTKE